MRHFLPLLVLCMVMMSLSAFGAENKFGIYGTWDGEYSWSTRDMDEQDNVRVLTADVPANFKFRIRTMDASGSVLSTDASASCDAPFISGGNGTDYQCAVNKEANYTFVYDPGSNHLTVTCNSVAGYAIYGTWNGSSWSAQEMSDESGKPTLSADVTGGFEFLIRALNDEGKQLYSTNRARCDDAYVAGGEGSNYRIPVTANYTFVYDPRDNHLSVGCNSVAGYGIYGTWDGSAWTSRDMEDENGTLTLRADLPAGFEFAIRAMNASGNQLGLIRNAACDEYFVSGGKGENYKIDLDGDYTFRYSPEENILDVVCNSIDDTGKAWWCPADMTGTAAGWRFDNMMEEQPDGSFLYHLDTSGATAEYTGISIFYAPSTIKWNTEGTADGNQINWNRVSQANVLRYVPAHPDEGADSLIETDMTSPMRSGTDGIWMLSKGDWTVRVYPLTGVVTFVNGNSSEPDDKGVSLILTPKVISTQGEAEAYGDPKEVPMSRDTDDDTFTAVAEVGMNDCVMINLKGVCYTFDPSAAKESVSLGGSLYRHTYDLMPVDSADPKGRMTGVDADCIFTVDPAGMTLTLQNDIETCVRDICGRESAAVYYTLQGRRVSRPSGGLYIRLREGRTDKVLVPTQTAGK